MRIAIDLTALMKVPTGVDVFLLELVRHLAKIDGENHYTLFVNFADRARLTQVAGPNMTLRACSLRARPMRLLFQQCMATAIADADGHDVFHSPSFLMPLRRGRGKHLLTVHDLTFFSMPRLHSRLHRNPLFLEAVRASMRRADLINVPSDATARDLVSSIPEVDARKIRLTPLGVDSRFCLAPREETARRIRELGLPECYVLAVGAIEPRKNLLTLLDAFEKLISREDTAAHLVLAGPRRWGASEVYRRAASRALRERVHFLGHVPDGDLPWVYRGATVFTYVSLGEGFGFPPLEAMACGIPIIASDNSSLRENLAGAAHLVPATDVDALSGAIRRLLASADEREQLSALGFERVRRFRWERTSGLVLNCYRELAAEGVPANQI